MMQWTYHLYIMIIVVFIYFEKSYTTFRVEFRKKLFEGLFTGFIIICIIELVWFGIKYCLNFFK